MKKLTLTMMALLIAGIVATSAFGFGWGRGPGFGYGPCARGEFGGYAGVDLTADQKAKLIEMRDANFKDIQPLREQMWAKRDELRKLWLEANPDQAKIAAAQKEMSSLRDQMQDKMTAYRLSALKVLTPEQQEKIRSWGPGRGFGPGRGYGPAGCPGGFGGRW
jgi:Spy/CpxP family protein refolding chaperone